MSHSSATSSVLLVNHWGTDATIIEAARMSTQKGFKGWGPLCPHGKRQNECWVDPACVAWTCEKTPGDERLLEYLYKHKHTTPFEMVGATFEVKAPIFVFREWRRHRTQSYNEMSARYTVTHSHRRTNKELVTIGVMRASANLHNWLRFLSLRDHPNAQEEIRVLAVEVKEHLRGLFPRTMRLFDEYR